MELGEESIDVTVFAHKMLAETAEAEARKWLKGSEHKAMLDKINQCSGATHATTDYFNNWCEKPFTLRNVSEYFLVDFLDAGTGVGQALRLDPVSAVLRCDIGDSAIDDSDHIHKAKMLRENWPNVFEHLLRLARKHAEICQNTIRAQYSSEPILLQRQVRDASRHWAIESWAIPGMKSSYAPITLRARIPLVSILSIRRRENEIVVVRQPWQSSIEVDEPDDIKEEHKHRGYASMLADWLESTARQLRNL